MGAPDAPQKRKVAYCEPVGKTPWDWIAGKNIAFMRAAARPSTSHAIMDMLRGAEVWARDHNLTLDDVVVKSSVWTADGRLVLTFTMDPEAYTEERRLMVPVIFEGGRRGEASIRESEWANIRAANPGRTYVILDDNGDFR
ncbi:MAG: hypothetical protein ACREQ5_12875 [Candidatus Dormibacteria bacterium]